MVKNCFGGFSKSFSTFGGGENGIVVNRNEFSIKLFFYKKNIFYTLLTVRRRETKCFLLILFSFFPRYIIHLVLYCYERRFEKDGPL